MSTDHRRPSTGAAEAALDIPAAPPLPPQRNSYLARTVFDRFRSGIKRAPSDAQGSVSPSLAASPLAARNYGRTKSQNTSHWTGLKIRALDINQPRTHAVLAGGKILKTIKIDGNEVTEAFNLREKALSFASGTRPVDLSDVREGVDVVSVQRDMLDIEDVAWSNGQFKNNIATAAANGKIMLYDIKAAGVEVARLHEHHRQVHKVDFHPKEGAFLLSGSQDGTVRLWDLRYVEKNVTIWSTDTFPGRNDGVRHVKWSPCSPWEFAVGTDNGTVQRWDTRNNKTPVLKIQTAHSGTCNSIDWHPDGKHLVSAGKDQFVKVWNASPDGRPKRPAFMLKAPREVQNVRWRPSCFVYEPFSEDGGSKHCTHLATSYKHWPVVHVWDLRRPSMPFREIQHRSNRGTTDILWRDRDLLWTVGREGDFTQTDVAYATCVLDRRPTSSFANSPLGDVAFFATGRPGRALKASADSEESTMQMQHRQSSQSPEPHSLGRSPGDDSFEEHFLATRSQPKHGRALSSKSSRIIGTTPPSAEEIAMRSTKELDFTMTNRGSNDPSQATRHGQLPGAKSASIFMYLAQKYKLPPIERFQDVDSFASTQAAFEHNANHAQRASFYRDAQTWRILGQLVSRETTRRVEMNRRARLLKGSTMRDSLERISKPEPRAIYSRQPLSVVKGSPSTEAANSSEQQGLQPPDRAHTPSTPIARPTKPSQSFESNASSKANAYNSRQSSSDTGVGSALDSPKATAVKPGLIEQEGDTPTDWQEQQEPHDGHQQLAHEQFVKQKSKAPLNLEDAFDQSKAINIPRMERHDSIESFMLFPDLSNSKQKLSNPGSYASTESHSLDYDSYSHLPKRAPGVKTGQSYNSMDKSSTDSDAWNKQQFTSGSSRSSELSKENLKLLEQSPPRLRDKSEAETRSAGDALLQEDIAEDSRLQRAHWLRLTSDSNAQNPAQKPDVLRRMSSQGTRVSQVSSSILTSAQTSALDSQPTPLHLRERPILSRGTTRNTLSILESEAPLELGSQEIIASDYLQPVPDEIVEKDAFPIKAKDALSELLSWYTNRGDAQMASHLLLMSAYLLALPPSHTNVIPDTSIIDDVAKKLYIETLTAPNIGFTHEDAISILQTYHVPLKQYLDMPSIQAEAILSTYHEQLLSSNLHRAAACLRRLAYPEYPAVYEQSLIDTFIGTLCGSCRKPIESALDDNMYCESCCTPQAECSICWTRTSPYALQGTKERDLDRDKEPSKPGSKKNKPASNTALAAGHLRSACIFCNHSLHIACAQMWFGGADPALHIHGTDPSAAACPVPGCMCQCGTRLLHRWQGDRASQSSMQSQLGQPRSVSSATRSLRRTNSHHRRSAATASSSSSSRQQAESLSAAASAAASTTASASAGSPADPPQSAAQAQRQRRSLDTLRRANSAVGPLRTKPASGDTRVKRDSWSVGESKAVARARGSLGIMKSTPIAGATNAAGAGEGGSTAVGGSAIEEGEGLEKDIESVAPTITQLGTGVPTLGGAMSSQPRNVEEGKRVRIAAGAAMERSASGRRTPVGGQRSGHGPGGSV